MVKTLRSHLSVSDLRRLIADAAATEPVRVQRRVASTGVILVADLRVCLGRAHAGQAVTVHVCETTLAIELDDGDTHPARRTTTQPVRSIKGPTATDPTPVSTHVCQPFPALPGQSPDQLAGAVAPCGAAAAAAAAGGLVVLRCQGGRPQEPADSTCCEARCCVGGQPRPRRRRAP